MLWLRTISLFLSSVSHNLLLVVHLFIEILCLSISSRLSKLLAMESSKVNSVKDLPIGLDPTTEEEYSSQSKLLQEFTNISSIDKAWTFKSENGMNRFCTPILFLISIL